MAFLLDGKKLPLDTPFSTGGFNYPANWLRHTTLEEKKAIGITEVEDDPVYDSRFYRSNGSAKALDDVNATDENGDLLKDKNGDQVVILGLKSIFKAQEKATAGSLLAKYDWYVVRKAEKSTAIPTSISTYRDGIRTACNTRETEIDACAYTAALMTLYSSKADGTPNMTQYPEDPNG